MVNFAYPPSVELEQGIPIEYVNIDGYLIRIGIPRDYHELTKLCAETEHHFKGDFLAPSPLAVWKKFRQLRGFEFLYRFTSERYGDSWELFRKALEKNLGERLTRFPSNTIAKVRWVPVTSLWPRPVDRALMVCFYHLVIPEDESYEWRSKVREDGLNIWGYVLSRSAYSPGSPLDRSYHYDERRDELAGFP